jgi:putative membrane protein
MIDDHGKSNQELKSLAQSEGVMLPSQLDPQHSKTLQRMQRLSGADFDREYMKMMLEDHRKDIKAFNDEGQGGDDPEVKLFAMRTLATLRAHLAMVETTLKTLEANAGRKPESATRPPPAAGQPEKGQQ